MKRKTKQGDPHKAVGYLRVSTEEQNLGPEAQREQLARWAQSNGVELVAVFEDLGISGGAPLDKRPGLLAALDALAEERAGVLLVAKRDRLARDIVAAAMIERLAERNGGRVLSADGASDGDGPEAELRRGIQDLFNQYERAIIRARTKAALAVKKAKGERVGSVPFGYQLTADGIHLEPHPEEQKTIRKIRRLRANGAKLREIVSHLNGNGARPRGRRWHMTTVHRLLSQEAA